MSSGANGYAEARRAGVQVSFFALQTDTALIMAAARFNQEASFSDRGLCDIEVLPCAVQRERETGRDARRWCREYGEVGGRQVSW